MGQVSIPKEGVCNQDFKQQAFRYRIDQSMTQLVSIQ